MSYITYTKTGPFLNGAAPGISDAFLNAMETMLAAGWFDSLITSNGSGIVTVAGLILSSGHIILPNNNTLQIKDTGGTARDVLYVDSANETVIQLANNTGGFKIKDISGNTIVHVDSGGNANFKAAVNANVSNP